jgi:hypothetical protein
MQARRFNLGVMYDIGIGVPQDYKEAAKWYRKAAEHGHAVAQNNLGAMYEHGEGVPQDYKEAAKWYRKAAEQGHAVAQNNLGEMYEHGRGVPQDKVIAYALYNLAASSSNWATGNRDAIVERMTPREIEAGQALTRALAQPGNFGKALDAYAAKPKGLVGLAALVGLPISLIVGYSLWRYFLGHHNESRHLRLRPHAIGSIASRLRIFRGDSRRKPRGNKKHQIAAIVVGIVLAGVSFLPVIFTMNRGLDLGHPNVVKVFLYPTIGVAVAAVIVFIAFLKDKGE